MKKFLFTIIISILAISTYAQPQRKPFERVHAAKVAYLTDRLQLSREQAERFWPVYNDFERERRTLRKKYFNTSNNNNNSNTTEEDIARQSIEDNLDYQQEELDLKRRYKDEFLKIISAQQITSLYKAEREFRQLLMHRLGDRPHHHGWR
jgi:hypothetical protein